MLLVQGLERAGIGNLKENILTLVADKRWSPTFYCPGVIASAYPLGYGKSLGFYENALSVFSEAERVPDGAPHKTGWAFAQPVLCLCNQ